MPVPGLSHLGVPGIQCMRHLDTGQLLGPVFARPQAWVVLEVVVGITMWAIAAGLIWG